MNNYTRIDPTKLTTAQLFGYLTQTIIPRPIALVSTCNTKGHVNLSPFSFFNAFSAHPPILVFSPSRSVRDNTTKHTLDNVTEHPEAVIHIVNHAMVQQTSLSSTAYERGINEFTKAGFTEQPSERVRPPRVEGAPAAFECRVTEVIPLGNEGGAGHLVICEVLLIHLRTEIVSNGTIDPLLLDPIARLGGDLYARLNSSTLFSVAKPIDTLGIGIDALPEHIRLSTTLKGNDLGMLGNVEHLPDDEAVAAFASSTEGQALLKQLKGLNAQQVTEVLHKEAQRHLNKGDVETAWRILLLR